MRRFRQQAVVVVGSLLLLGCASFVSAQQQVEVVARVAPILEVGELQFKDLNKNGVLDPYEDWRLPAEQRADDLLSQMTMEEKAAQLVQIILTLDPGGSLPDQAKAAAEGGMGFLLYSSSFPSNQAASEGINQAMEWAEGTRLGIPLLNGCDDIKALPFMANIPNGLTLGLTGDVELAEELFREVWHESFMAVGLRYLLDPRGDTATDPRYMRIQQTYGENADRNAEFVRAAVIGMQGPNGIDKDSVLCVVKHFPGEACQEGGEDLHIGSDLVMMHDEVTFREMLKPFQAAIDAGVGGVMTCQGYSPLIESWYPDIADGGEQGKILFLREELGFTGIIYTESGGSFADKIRYGASMSVGGSVSEIVEQVSEEDLDNAIRVNLVTKFKLGLFENPYTDPDRAAEVEGSEKHWDLVIEGWRQAMTLLTNDGTLPLSEDTTVLVAGLRLSTLVDEIGKRVGADRVFYVESDPAAAARLAAACDVVIVAVDAALQRDANGDLYSDITTMPGATLLRGEPYSLDLLKAIDAVGTPIVAVYVPGRDEAGLPPIGWVADNASAILTPLGSQARGRPVPAMEIALAETLFGEVSPSGKLCIQIPRSHEQSSTQREGVSYDIVDPLFDYQYGMSYGTSAQFAYENLAVSKTEVLANEPFTVTVTATNEGEDGSKKIVVYADGVEIGSHFLALGSEDTREVVISCLLHSPGPRRISIAELSPVTVSVRAQPATFEYSGLSVPSVVRVAETVAITAEVTNFGSFEGTTYANLYIDGRVVDSTPVMVPAGRGGVIKEVGFTYVFTRPGVYQVGIGNLTPKAIEVLDSVNAPYATVASAQAEFYQLGNHLYINAAGSMGGDQDGYGAIYLNDAMDDAVTATVQVIEQGTGGQLARAGIMVKNDITAAGSSPGYVTVSMIPSYGGVALFEWDSDGDGYVDGMKYGMVGVYPCWLKLERSGTTFTGSFSRDGTSWNQVGNADVPTAETLQDVGLFASSAAANLMFVKFGDFIVAEPQPEEPTAEEPEKSSVDQTPAVALTIDSTLGELMADPDAMAILQRLIPDIVSNPQIIQATGMTLAAVAPYTQGALTDELLAAIAEELNKLYEEPAVEEPPAKTLTVDSTLGELMADPDAMAILQRLIPDIVSNPQIIQATGMTLAAVAPYTQGALTDELLAAIAEELAKLYGED